MSCEGIPQSVLSVAMGSRPDKAAEIGQVRDDDQTPAGPAMAPLHGDAKDGNADGGAGETDGDAVGDLPGLIVLYASHRQGQGQFVVWRAEAVSSGQNGIREDKCIGNLRDINSSYSALLSAPFANTYHSKHCKCIIPPPQAVTSLETKSSSVDPQSNGDGGEDVTYYRDNDKC